MKRLYTLVSTLGLVGMLTACESIVDNFNTDPNNPTNASASLILTGTQLANVTVQEGHTARVVGMWAGYFTGTDWQYKDIYNYNVTGSSFDQIWENMFYGVVEQTKLVIAKSESINNRLVIGIAKIVGTTITKLLDPSATATYRGNAKTDETARFNYYFLTRGTSGAIPVIPNTNSTTTQKGVFTQTASFPLVSYEENLLTVAEAGMRSAGFAVGLEKLNAYRKYMSTGGYIDPTYRTATLTFKDDPYFAEDFAVGGLLNRDRITPDQALLREILQERYVTFFGQKLGFFDVRRTRQEAVGVKLTPNAGTVLPERLIYSEAEVNSNINAPRPVPGIFVGTPVNK